MVKPTLLEAQAIIDARDYEKNRVKTCIEANICPECGAKLMREDYKKNDPPKVIKFLFWNFIDRGTKYDIRIICSKDSSHYEYTYYYPPDDGY